MKYYLIGGNVRSTKIADIIQEITKVEKILLVEVYETFFVDNIENDYELYDIELNENDDTYNVNPYAKEFQYDNYYTIETDSNKDAIFCSLRLLQRIYVTELSLKYVYREWVVHKEVIAKLSNGKLIKITTSIKDNFPITELYKGKIIPHVTVKHTNSFHINLSDPNFEQNLESITTQLKKTLLSDNFHEIIKDDQFVRDKVRISPRIKYYPVFYTFMNYSNCLILRKINKELAIEPIYEPPIYEPPLIFSKHQDIYSELYDATNERLLEIVNPFIENYNYNYNYTRSVENILCGVVMEKISYIDKEILSNGKSLGKIVADSGDSWKLESGNLARKENEDLNWYISLDFIIAVTGETGIGKSYLTHQCIKNDLIFETDGCTKETFFEKYTEKDNPPVIVVGLKDPTFNLEFIKNKLTKSVYECKIVNLLDMKQSVEKDVQEKRKKEKEEIRRKQPIVKLIGFNREVYPSKAETDAGTFEGINYIYKLYLDNNDLIILEENYSTCWSGWTDATTANMETIPYENRELNECDKLEQSIRYFGVEISPGDNIYDGDIFTLEFENDISIVVDEYGGDHYYPNGKLEFINFFNDNPIQIASKNGKDDEVRCLLAKGGVNPAANNNLAIQYASQFGHDKVVKLLLTDMATCKGVDPGANDNYAIKWASYEGYHKVVKLLLEDGRVDVTADDNSAIQYACRMERPEVVKLLLQDGRADPSTNNNIAMFMASRKGYHEVVKLLLQDNRVEPGDIYNDNYANVIQEASFFGHHEVVKLLLQDKRVDPSDDDNYAIKYASKNGHHEVVKLLLQDKRVDPSDYDNYAIKYASSRGYHEVVEAISHRSIILNKYKTLPDKFKNDELKEIDKYFQKFNKEIESKTSTKMYSFCFMFKIFFKLYKSDSEYMKLQLKAFQLLAWTIFKEQRGDTFLIDIADIFTSCIGIDINWGNLFGIGRIEKKN